MLGAMYENGGNVTQRHLDGHPQLFVYPFESQLGTRLVSDHLSSMFPAKYRWPEFSLAATPEEDFDAIIDEECRVRARTPHVSKFRDWPFEFCDEGRKSLYVRRVVENGRGRAGNVAAFFAATFDAWKDHHRSGEERIYVGYSPIITVDGEKILEDLPGAILLHVVRNPWSAYADTKRRPVPLGLATYTFLWVVNQYHALLLKTRHGNRVLILRVEDVMADPVLAFRPLCEVLGIDCHDAMKAPSWNGTALEQIYPWGTIRKASPDANRSAALELSAWERAEILARTAPYLERFDYKDFIP
jgi:hypothetical protein